MEEGLVEELAALRQRVRDLEAEVSEYRNERKLLIESEQRFRLLYEKISIPYQSLSEARYRAIFEYGNSDNCSEGRYHHKPGQYRI